MRDSTFDYNDPCKNNALCESNDLLVLLKTKITPVVILQRLRYSGDSSSEGELCWVYEDDPEYTYDGASMDPSQPCDNVRGVSYTLPGWRRVYFKKKFLKWPSLDSHDSAGPAKKLKFD